MLKFREANINDVELIFNWRNLPEIIALSSSQKSVSWSQHVIWFEKAIKHNNSLIMIIFDDELPIGQVRFDLLDTNNNKAEISIYLVAKATGQGHGANLIKNACYYAKHRWPRLLQVTAEIREVNIRSIKAFVKAGFIQTNEQAGNACCIMMGYDVSEQVVHR